MIANLHIPAREWVPSRKRKPNGEREVLGVVRFSDGTTYVEIVNYDEREKEWVTANGLETVRVIHWCELPNLPSKKVNHAG